MVPPMLVKARALARAFLSFLIDLCALTHAGHLAWTTVCQVRWNELDPVLLAVDLMGLAFCSHHIWHRRH